MPRRFPHMLDLLWGEREKQRKLAQDQRAKDAVRLMLEKRDERSARLKLTEGRGRVGGWT